MTDKFAPTFINNFVEEQQKEIAEIKEHFVFVAKLGVMNPDISVLRTAVDEAVDAPRRKAFEAIDYFYEKGLITDINRKFLYSKIITQIRYDVEDIEKALLTCTPNLKK